jgi:GNAT superfamily N-acetyltransferase
MPLALRHRDDPVPEMTPLAELTIVRETSAARMAAIQNRAEHEIAARFDGGHRAYVALWGGEPAAWGWVAVRAAEIGELKSSFAVPDGDRYLWNFVTLAAHRGKGIYPRLLDAIVRAESRDAERFWVAYAPENHASGAGIRKAGFVTVAELSFDSSGRPAIQSMVSGGGLAASRVLGLPQVEAALAQCWRCARAAAAPADMSCAEGRCACDYQRPQLACAE